jgi:hypothetical protein
MFGSANYDDMPSLRNYSDARLFYSRIRPIRGKTIRPLGKRRAQHRHIIEIDNGAAYACVLYNTHCVTFHQDGRVVLDHGGYITTSTAAFMYRVLAGGSVYRQGGEMTVRMCGATHVIPPDGLTIINGEVRNAPLCVVHKINRKKTNAVRARYKDFTTYVVTILKLKNHTIERDEVTTDAPAFYNVSSAQSKRYATNMLACAADQETWWKAAQMLFQMIGGSYNRWSKTLVISPDQVHSQMTRALLYVYPHEMLDATTLPEGQWKIDAYRTYVSA